MATIVYTDYATILIDPAVSLAPRRFSLPPHEIEWEALHKVAAEIELLSEDADIIIITHYHYDHHDPGKYVSTGIYRNKKVFIKDPRNNINISQRIRSSRFLKIIRGLTNDIVVADGNCFRYGELTIKFSEPVPHGPNDKLGYVIMVGICEGNECIVFTSDVEGPTHPYVIDFIKDINPFLVIMDGPATYLSNDKYPKEHVNTSIKLNTKLLNEVSKLRSVILDHHLLRDINYTEVYREISSNAKNDVKILTAAEYLGMKPNLLEARRRELYGLVSK